MTDKSKPLQKHFGKILGGILVLAFLVRLAAIVVVGDEKLDHEYATLVPNLLTGKGFSYYSMTQSGEITNEYVPDAKINMPSAFKPPIYSLIVAGFGLIFGIGSVGIRIVEVVQALVGVIICWLIYDVARLKFNKPAAFWALLIASVYPLLAFASAQISDLTLQIFLRVVLFWLLFKLELQPNSRGLIVLTGISLGALLIARTEMWLYLPLILLWMILVFKKQWLKLFAPVTIIALVVVAPWIIRNYIQFGVFTLNTSGGLNLWEGQNEQAKGIPSWYTWPPAELSPAAAAKVEALAPTKDYEVKLDKIYLDEAKAFIVSHPGRVVELGLKKFIFYWGSVYPGVEFIYSSADSPLYWLPWFFVLPFFIYGLILNFKSLQTHILFHASFILSTLTIMAFFVLPKYIVFVIPWVFVFAASGMAVVAERLMRRVLGRSLLEFE